MESILDGIGYLLVVLVLLGSPVLLVLYGLYVALTRGVKEAEPRKIKRAA